LQWLAGRPECGKEVVQSLKRRSRKSVQIIAPDPASRDDLYAKCGWSKLHTEASLPNLIVKVKEDRS